MNNGKYAELIASAFFLDAKFVIINSSVYKNPVICYKFFRMEEFFIYNHEFFTILQARHKRPSLKKL